METLAMLSKVYGESTTARSKVYEWHRRFKNGRKSIEDNELVGLTSISLNAKNVALMSEKIVFEKIVAKYLHKSLKLHTSRRRRLIESIHRKWY
ncbi:hypothetical protein TNCV_985131 [Trichonephila clavipes]|nr:hypothetical protein TNCV_985131 [Trichonephila clavipes]